MPPSELFSYMYWIVWVALEATCLFLIVLMSLVGPARSSLRSWKLGQLSRNLQPRKLDLSALNISYMYESIYASCLLAWPPKSCYTYLYNFLQGFKIGLGPILQLILHLFWRLSACLCCLLCVVCCVSQSSKTTFETASSNSSSLALSCWIIYCSHKQ